MCRKGDEEMKVKIKRVWGADITPYKTTLDKYNASYVMEKNEAIVEINDLNKLFSLAKDLDEDLIINRYDDNLIEIYDDYVE
jgi:hypothetical protein